MRYLVAVSGGIDSVVLLDMLARRENLDLIVAHFDHGTRNDSAADARFVEALAKKYHLPFVATREELGSEVSEERARTARYEFLRREAKKRNAVIVTAHHQDDIIESIAINLIRGTGWRGLAVLAALDIKRPLLHFSKQELREYAHTHHLEWVEDSTNEGDTYLRNRLRRRIKLILSDADKDKVIALWKHQTMLKTTIEDELSQYIRKDTVYDRHLLIMVDQQVAGELLRAQVAAKCGWAPTRPQTNRALVAVKTAKPGSTFEIASGAKLRFMTKTFIVETP